MFVIFALHVNKGNMKNGYYYYSCIKKFLLFVAFICSSAIIIAQKTVSAFVVDAETGMPVELVAVVSSVDYTITNHEGEFLVKVSNDEKKIYLSHLSYNTKEVNLQQLSDTIFIEPKFYQLEEISVIPTTTSVSFLKTVWDKYNKLFEKKRERDFPRQTFFYRQTLQNDDIYTEYLECFFSAPVGTGVMTMSLHEGRYAVVYDHQMGMIMNYFRMSQLTPFRQSSVLSREEIICFLVKDFDKYYDIRLDRILSEDEEDEVRVYEFTPRKEKLIERDIAFSGFLFIRIRDLSIVRVEANTNYIRLSGIRYIKSQSYNFTIVYKDVEGDFPMIETIKSDTEIIYFIKGEEYIMKLSSVLFSTDIKLESSGAVISPFDNLVDNIKKLNYNQEFWDNNPIIKRSEIEQKAVSDFVRLGYFGSMKLD